ncbi:MAG: 50S ribosomal protein L18 [Candidatus Moranbacteria bacterium]|nr:50S ribosomal protein L18 [Candidatus Moranbacteria bacterium]
MTSAKDSNQKRLFRKKRSRAKISGSASIPRISVFRSNKQLYVQLIDDQAGVTLTSARSKEVDKKLFNAETAKETGKKLAEKASKKKIKEAVFDRSGYRYHGKVKALAEGMREQGMKF